MADYATGLDLKQRLTGLTTVNDELYEAAVTAASRFVDWYCDRVFSKSTSAETRTFRATTARLVNLPDFSDVVSVATLKTDPAGTGSFDVEWSAGDYQLAPIDAQYGPEPRPYTRIEAVGSARFPCPSFTGRSDRVQITGVFGWPVAPPAAVREATLIVASKLFRLKDAPFGYARLGEEGYARVRAENPEATQLLEPYRRHIVMVG